MNLTQRVLVISAVIWCGLFANLPVYAEQQTTEKPEKDMPVVTIEKLKGGQMILETPVKIYGKFKTGSIVITNLNLELVQSLVAEKEGKVPGTFMLTLRDGKGVFTVVAQEDAKIIGVGEWGKETISFGTLSSVNVAHTAPAKDFDPQYMWLCTLTDGHEFTIEWYNTFHGTVAETSLILDLDNISSMEFNQGVALITASDGQTLSGWNPAVKELSTNLMYGSVKIQWEKVQKLRKIKGPVNDKKKKAQTSVKEEWRVKLHQGPLVGVSELQPRDNAKLNSEIFVKTFNWRDVISVAPDKDGVNITLVDKRKWFLSGDFFAKTRWGKLNFKMKTVEEMTRAVQATTKIDLGKEKVVDGTLVTASGHAYKAGSPKLDSSNTTNFREYLVVKSEPVELWTSSDKLLSYPLRMEKKRIFSDMPILKKFGALDNIRAIEFENSMGKFIAPIEVIKEYVPQTNPQPSKKVFRKKYILSCKARKPDTTDCTFSVSYFNFARYPASVWSGSYYSTPWRWSLGNTLYFNRSDDNGRIDIAFEKIRKIEFQGEYSGSSRKAILTSAKGSSLEGQIYPGDLGQGSGGGVYNWNSQMEGFLGEIGEDLYVFMPFAKFQVIEITNLPESQEKK